MTSMTAAQALARPFTAVRAAAQPKRTSYRLVVRAQQQVDAPKGLPALLKEAEALKPAAITLAANVLMALPAHAEAGKIFDFNLTLPIMIGEFLLLMVFLDKTWFGPVGAMLDKRDEAIRNKLSQFKDQTTAVGDMQAEAEKVIADARAEAQKVVMSAKAEAQAEAAAKLAAVKEKLDKELNQALAALEAEKQAALTNLDDQVDKLSGEILTRILPEGVKV